MLTKSETAFVYVWAFVLKLRRIFVKVYPWYISFMALGFAGGIECGTINHTNALPILITVTIISLIYIICVLLERAEERRSRLRHRATRR